MSKMFDSLPGSLAEAYAKLLRKFPIPTAIVTLLVGSIGAFMAYRDDHQRRVEEQRRRESLATYSQQVQQLDSVQQSLKDLSDFVTQQRTRLQDSEQVISKLQEEKQRIEPLVQADRKVVESVFQLQEQRAAGTIKRERWIGFGFGVGASLLASFIYAVIVFAWKRSRKNGAANDT